jgi:exonuclease SbcC
MHILSVELENIKRHEQARYEFMLGTNAISGPNGAGKSTILEAIGFALFDSLPYKKEDFLRRGATTGTVRVTFESGDDGRAYTVVRNTRNTYYVYDPQTKTRVAEQKADVLVWLRHHLGVDPDTDLDELFTTTIGVPQGTFTAIFAEPAGRRRPVFERILRVEEYQRSAEALKETVHHFQARIHEAERSLAGLEGRLLRMPDLEVQARQVETELATSEQRHAAAQAELAVWRGRLAECEELATAIARDRQELAALDTRLDFTRREREAAQLRLAESEQASAELESLAPQVAAFEVAERELATLETERAERDRLRLARSEVQRRLDEAVFARETLETRLKALAEDALQLEGLKPRLGEQERLEADRNELKARLAEAKSLEERIRRTSEEIDSWQKRQEQIEGDLSALDALKDAPERVIALQLSLGKSQEALRTVEEADLARQALEQQDKVIAEAIANHRKAIATHDRTLTEKAGLREVAARLEALTEQGQTLRDQLSAVEAELARDRKASTEFNGAMCPILHVGCPILEGQSPEDYFKERIATGEQKARDLETAIADLRKRWKEANDAHKQVMGLDLVQAARDEATVSLQAREAEARILAERLAALPARGDQRTELTAAIARDREALAQAQADAARYGQREGLLAQRATIVAEQSRRQTALEADRARAREGQDLGDRLAACERALAELGDPRSRCAALERVLLERPALESEREKRAADAAGARAELAALDDQLRPFETLDLRMQDTVARRSAAEPAHRRSLTLAPVALDRPARAQARDAVQETLDGLEGERGEVALRLAKREADYRPDEHAGLQERVEGFKAEAIRLEQALGFLRQQLDAVRREMEDLRRVESELAEAIAQRDHLKDQLSFVEFARQTLKEAGPYITEAYLISISLEADRLFREITGLHHVHLRWRNDYEILLEEGGRERPFANLSGGEQMVAALSVRLALLKETSSIDLAFFDEPTTNMDENRRSSLALQIGQIQTFRQLFVISHDDSFEQWTDHVVRLDDPAPMGMARA